MVLLASYLGLEIYTRLTLGFSLATYRIDDTLLLKVTDKSIVVASMLESWYFYLFA